MTRFCLTLIVAGLFCQSAWAYCFDEAGRAAGVAPELLRAIAKVESSLNAKAMNMSHLERTGSYDIGLMQINSRNLTKYGVSAKQLVDEPCTNVKIGARILRETIGASPTWEGVGKYNAACTQLKGQDCFNARAKYAWKVFRALQGGSELDVQKRGKARLTSVQSVRPQQAWATTIDVSAVGNSPDSEAMLATE